LGFPGGRVVKYLPANAGDERAYDKQNYKLPKQGGFRGDAMW